MQVSRSLNYSYSFIEDSVSKNIESSHSNIVETPEVLSEPEELETILSFLDQVVKGDEIDTNSWPSFLPGNSQRLLPGTAVGCCLCAAYPLSIRVELAKEFVANIIQDPSLIKNDCLTCYFFGSGLLLQELLQIRFLLEETQEGRPLAHLKGLIIYVKDLNYHYSNLIENEITDRYLTSLTIFEKTVNQLCLNFCKQYSCNNLPLETPPHPETHIFSSIDTFDAEALPITNLVSIRQLFQDSREVDKIKETCLFASYRNTEEFIENNKIPLVIKRLGISIISVFGSLFEHGPQIPLFIEGLH